MAVEDTIKITLGDYNEAHLHSTFASHTVGYITMTGSKGDSKAGLNALDGTCSSIFTHIIKIRCISMLHFAFVHRKYR